MKERSCVLRIFERNKYPRRTTNGGCTILINIDKILQSREFPTDHTRKCLGPKSGCNNCEVQQTLLTRQYLTQKLADIDGHLEANHWPNERRFWNNYLDRLDNQRGQTS